MITITERKQIERASRKAQELKPRVRFVETNVYAVTGTTGNEYIVKFGRIEGKVSFTCTCRAHLGSKVPRPCYHSASAWSAHRLVVAIHKGAATKAAPTAPAAAPTGGSDGNDKCVICGESWPGSALSKRAICPDCELSS